MHRRRVGHWMVHELLGRNWRSDVGLGQRLPRRHKFVIMVLMTVRSMDPCPVRFNQKYQHDGLFGLILPDQNPRKGPLRALYGLVARPLDGVYRFREVVTL